MLTESCWLARSLSASSSQPHGSTVGRWTVDCSRSAIRSRRSDSDTKGWVEGSRRVGRVPHTALISRAGSQPRPACGPCRLRVHAAQGAVMSGGHVPGRHCPAAEDESQG
eukprot:2344366-Rhodomonas_salina.2